MLRPLANGFTIPSLLVLLAVSCFATLGQTPAADGWMRVQSNDGEFSVEVPAKHRVFYNPDGFQISKNSNDVLLKNMWMLSAVTEGTLISFEVYDADKRAMDALYDYDAFAKHGRKVSESKGPGVKIKQIVNRNDKYYSIRQFFSTKKHVYVLTTANRTGEVPPMRRFLDSVRITDTDSSTATDKNATRFSQLNATDIEVEFLEAGAVPTRKAVSDPKPVPPDPTVKPFVLIRGVRPSYVDAARASGTQGKVQLKLRLADDGFIPKLTVTRSLPDGLLRQAIFASIRTKFLPKEKNGVPVTVIVTMEFGFTIF